MRYKKVKGGIVLVGECNRDMKCEICKHFDTKQCLDWEDGKSSGDKVESKVIKPVKRR